MSYKTLQNLYDESEYYNNKQYQGPLIFEENPNIATAVDKGYSNPEPSTGIAKICKGNLDHHLKIDGVT